MLYILKKSLIALLFFPLLACAEQNETYTEGEYYKTISKPVITTNQNKIEVVELFWYGCPHCYSLEPLVNKWAKDLPSYIDFQRMPAVMARSWEVHARAYYAAEILGVSEQAHEMLFTAIHKHNERIFDQTTLTEFYVKQGLDQAAFNKVFKSFAVNSKIQQAKTKQRGYQATGVPAVIVNGKYLISTTMKAGTKDLFKVVNYLVEKERKLLQQQNQT